MTKRRIRRTAGAMRRGAPPQGMLLRLSLDVPDTAPSVALCRRTLRCLLAALAVDPVRAYEIELALGEATTNVIRHAYSHPGHRYTVCMEIFMDRVRLRVADQGRGFRRADVPEPEEEKAGGWGLWLIEQLAASATVRPRRGGGSLLEAEFPLAAPIALPPAVARSCE
jgi:anti-sigma regulatory factor (Ser/Thr protein kinase)